MNKDEAKNIIRSVFSSEFDERSFQKFIANLLVTHKPTYSLRDNKFVKDSFKSFILKYEIVGYFEDKEGNKIDILQVTLSNSTSLERARTAQRNFVADYLKTNNKNAALVAFVPSKKEGDWRLSFIKLEYLLKLDEGKIKTEEDITPAKRWSFLVGENEGSHTAQSRFIDLLISEDEPNLAEIESAFDIEKVTKEFFDKYVELFFQLQEHLEDLIQKDDAIKKDFKEKEISSVDFAKKTLGQIVFLYFLQKKGWFGVAPDKEWGEGSKKFIRKLFERRESYGENFFNDVLEPLFYEALAQDRGEESIYPRLNNCRMPFLNGGLFEPMNGYAWETTNIIIPDELFSNDIEIKEGGTGTGILDVFDRYNFTVNENEPLEKEVAVDPEMLGKVFENLLDIKDRKSEGTFYTPREIVHYMCKENLINYLNTETNSRIPQNDLEVFIQKGDRIIENDRVAKEKIDEKELRGYEYKGTYKLLLPKSITERAGELDELLQNIKVADPAVGSGAFPLGMINEIVRARKVLNIYLKDNISDYELKQHTITHSIYGVDKNSGAVDIAKLRLWLALVVDEKTPHPLPNLDHKIMQGNSLISEYEGIKLFDESFLEKVEVVNDEKIEITNKINKLQKEYLDLHAKDELDSIKKIELLKEIKTFQRRLKVVVEKKDNLNENMGLFDVPQKKQAAKEKASILQFKIEEYISESHKTKKQELKSEIDELKWDLIEVTLQEQGRENKFQEVQEFRRKNVKPFFIWKLEFVDVFKENGGFDIVIGNPPYIMEDEDKDAFDGLHSHPCYEGKTDIWHIFVCKGISLLRRNGSISYIAKNQWLTSASVSRMRKKLYRDTQVKSIIDFGSNLMFENADVQTMIFVAQKNKKNKIHKINYYKFEKQDISQIKMDLENININFLNKEIVKDYNETKNLTFSSSEKEIILTKIDDKINFEFNEKKEIIQGIIGAPDKYFIIKKEELVKFNKNEKKYLKMLHTHTERYYTNDTDKYIFYISKSNFENKSIDNFPNVKKYFEPNKEALIQKKISYKSPNKPYFYLHRERNEIFFKDGAKLVWAKRTEGKKFTYTEKAMYGTANLFFIKSARVNLKYIAALLNSKLMYFYMNERLKHTGELLQIDKNQFMKIPLFIPDDISNVINLVEQILEINSQENCDFKKISKIQKGLEEKINKIIYDLYDLAEEEVAIIEKVNI